MNNQQWQELYKTSQNILNEIDFNNIKEKDFILGGAALAYLNDKTLSENTQNMTCNNFINAISGIDFIPNCRIDELKLESLRMYIKYMEEKTAELTERSEIRGELAEKALENMLKIDVEIAELIYQTADTKEREKLREAFHKIGKAYKVE